MRQNTAAATSGSYVASGRLGGNTPTCSPLGTGQPPSVAASLLHYLMPMGRLGPLMVAVIHTRACAPTARSCVTKCHAALVATGLSACLPHYHYTPPFSFSMGWRWGGLGTLMVCGGAGGIINGAYLLRAYALIQNGNAQHTLAPCFYRPRHTFLYCSCALLASRLPPQWRLRSIKAQQHAACARVAYGGMKVSTKYQAERKHLCSRAHETKRRASWQHRAAK